MELGAPGSSVFVVREGQVRLMQPDANYLPAVEDGINFTWQHEKRPPLDEVCKSQDERL